MISIRVVHPPSNRRAVDPLNGCTSVAMVKYRPVFDKLRERNMSHDEEDAIPNWLNTWGSSPSHFQDIAPPASPLSASSHPATLLHLRKRKRPSTRKPLQPSTGNQAPPKSKRKVNNREEDADEQLPRQLRDKAGLKKPARYREEEQVLHRQTGLTRGLGSIQKREAKGRGSPQKQQAKGRGRGDTLNQGLAIGSGQHLADRGSVLVISPGNASIPMEVQGRDSSSPDRHLQSPSESSHAADWIAWMARLSPGVCFFTPSECLKGRGVPQSVTNFWLNYFRSDDSNRFIPNYFQEEIVRQAMTPNRTKEYISKEYFTDIKEGWYGNFLETELDFVFKEVRDVIKMAGKYRNAYCTEAHWMAVVVHPLLRVLRRLAKYESATGFEQLEVADIKPLNKRIDGALGLSLTSLEEDVLIKASYNDAVRSINPINDEFGLALIPFFAHIGIELPYTSREPGPKLGVWAAAEFSKRELEGYSLDMPIASISIIGDRWYLWVAYPEGFGEDVLEDVDYGPCVLMGPEPIGDTLGIRGVFEILHYLCQIADWGLKEYRPWFEKEILRKYGWIPEEEKAKKKVEA